MATRTLSCFLLAALLSACALFEPKPVPTAAELVGSYHMGDGLGICQNVQLLSDFTLVGSNCGGRHWGLGTRAFQGTWSLDGAILQFSTPRNDIGTAEAFYWKGEPAFVEIEYKHGNEVTATWVYTRATD